MEEEERYCIRCDQLATTDTVPLFEGPEQEEPSWWVHRKCFAAHHGAVGLAQLKAFCAGIGEMAQVERSGPVVDLKRARLISSLADAFSKVGAKLQQVEAMRTELERLGIDPDKVLREHRDERDDER
jgi:hypothetical protein